MRSRTVLAVLVLAVAIAVAAPHWHRSRPPAPPVAAAAAAAIVVAFGDSVPAGTACRCNPFPDLVAGRLSPPGIAMNLAVPGSTASDLSRQIERADSQTAIRQADVVLVMAGANDLAPVFDDNGRTDAAYARVAARVKADLTATVERIRQLSGGPVQVLLLGYWNVVEDGDVGLYDYGEDGVLESESATRYANDAIRLAAVAGHATYIPTDAAFKGLAGQRNPTGLLASDGDHPNAQGHELLADLIIRGWPAPAGP